MKVEITKVQELTIEQERFVNLHSIFNILNIISSSVGYVSLHYDTKKILLPSERICTKLISSLHELSTPGFTFKSFNESKMLIKENIQEAVEAYSDLKKDEMFLTCMDNLDSLFKVLEIRVEEAVLILSNPKQWVSYTKEEVVNSLGQFLEAAEKNSFGKYKIAFNPKRETPSDYQVFFKVESDNEGAIKIPILMNDIIRDTVANSRKYSKERGDINAYLSIKEGTIIYTITDFGIGIPEEEIHEVVLLGKRAKNTKSYKTYGGGAGLTKVALATNYLSGKMWIDSKENEGTTIILEIPVPEESLMRA